jgi:hypothetical protein
MSTRNRRNRAAGASARNRDYYTEAKEGFKTSEFYAMVVFVLAVLAATYLDGDSLAREDGWRFAAYAVVAYIVSRGLAKLGVREPYTDDDNGGGGQNT